MRFPRMLWATPIFPERTGRGRGAKVVLETTRVLRTAFRASPRPFGSENKNPRVRGAPPPLGALERDPQTGAGGSF